MSPTRPVPERPLWPQAPELPLATAPEDESPLAADERALEALAAEQEKDTFLEQAEAAPTSSVQATGTAAQAPAAPAEAKDEVTVELEKILEDGLGEYVAAMPEEARVRFLYKGQETANAIAIMVHGLKTHAKKVVELIRSWLLTIPGVNKFFLEQEAKIKTDKILELEREYREQQGK